MNVSKARKRALEILNKKNPDHPPEVYFIRRNDHMIDKYLDPEEMSSLIERAEPRIKDNYILFKLDQKDKDNL